MQVGKLGKILVTGALSRINNSKMYDILGGAGGIGNFCARRGLESVIYDTSISPEFDVTKHHFTTAFGKACKEGVLGAAMFATPCASYSLAASRGG